MMSVRLCMKQIGFPCSARPQRSHGIIFGHLYFRASALTLSSSPLPLSLSHVVSFSLSLPPSLLLTFLFTASYLARQLWSLKADVLWLSLFGWSHVTPGRSPLPPTPRPAPPSQLPPLLDPLTLGLGLCSTSIIGQVQSGLQRRSQSFWKSDSQNTASDFCLFTGIKSWHITMLSEDERLLHNHPSADTMRSHVCPSNRWSETCLIADNVLAGPQLNYWVSESTKLSDVGLA